MQDIRIDVAGLGKSYGPETLRIYRMKPELGPPELEEIVHPDEDVSWAREWASFCGAIGQAIADFDNVIRLKPNDAGAFNNRANAYLKRGDLAHAIADFAR